MEQVEDSCTTKPLMVVMPTQPNSADGQAISIGREGATHNLKLLQYGMGHFLLPSTQVAQDTQSEVGQLYSSHIKDIMSMSDDQYTDMIEYFDKESSKMKLYIMGEGKFDPMTAPQPSPFGPPPFAIQNGPMDTILDYIHKIQSSIKKGVSTSVLNEKIKVLEEYVLQLPRDDLM